MARKSGDRKSGQRGMYIIAFCLLALGLAGLLVSGVKKDSVYFLNVSEALAKGLQNLDQARLFGTVKAKGLQQTKDQVGVRFLLADSDHPQDSIQVHYAGAVPDTFQPGAEVIVEGSPEAAEYLFHAHTLMTKCPSKYTKE